MFIEQLMNFVSSIYITSTKPFRNPFKNINTVKNWAVGSWEGCGMRHHNTRPVLFRGGLSFGDEVLFSREEQCIFDSKYQETAPNVTGRTYLNAVKLERSGKGPHLFCDKSVVDQLLPSKQKYVRIVDKEKGLYEIVWTIAGCEACNCWDDEWANVSDSIQEKMLPAAINLYNYYKSDEKLKSYYESLLELICYGIIKYAEDECSRGDDTKKIIEINLSQNNCDYVLPSYQL